MYNTILKGLYYPDLVILDQDFKVLHSEGFIQKFQRSDCQSLIGNHFEDCFLKPYSDSIKMGLAKAEETGKHVHVDNISGDCAVCLYGIKKEENEQVWIVQFGRPAYSTADPDIISITDSEVPTPSTYQEPSLETRVRSFQEFTGTEDYSFFNLFRSLESLIEKNSSSTALVEIQEHLRALEEDLTIRERELVQLRKDFNLFHELSGVGILRLNSRLELRYWNKNTQKFLLSSSPERSDNLRDLEFIDPNIREHLLNWVDRSMANKTPEQFHVKTNYGFSFLFFLYPIHDEEKGFQGMVISVNDVSEQFHLQEELRTERNTMELASANAKIAVWRWNLEANEVTGNQMLKEMYGLGDPFNLEEWQNSIHPDDAVEAGKIAEDYRQGRTKIFAPRYRYHNQVDGTTRYIQERGLSVKLNKDGEPQELTGISLDLTDLWKTQQDLSESLLFSEKLTENIGYSIMVHDLVSNKDIYSNSTYEVLSGYSMEEMNAMTSDQFWDCIHPDDRDVLRNHLDSLPEIKEAISTEYRFKRKDGQWIWCLVKDSPFERDKDGKVVKVIGLIMDITESKQIKEDLIDAKRRAESANIYKNSFLTNMSHEIRTPMNGVVAFAQLLAEERDEDERKSFIEIIQTSAYKLLHLIDDIIDVARMEAGDLVFDYHEVHLYSFLNEIYQAFSPLVEGLENKKLDFDISIPKELEEEILITDKSRLHQVMLNLLNNAIKFSHEGKVVLGIERKEENTIQIFVQDDGIGISSEYFDSIFERFNQIEYRSRVKYGGAGLGLAICKGIIKELGGAITVESERDKGSRFTINLPLRPVQEIPEDPRKRVHDIHDPNLLEDKHILIVDDDKTVVFFLKRALKSTKAKLSVAKTGKEAVDIYEKGIRPDAVLMDIRMPELDGIKATKKILEFDPAAKVIIQTAFALQQEKEKCLDAGCVGYLNKPLDVDILIETLEQQFQ